MTKVLDPNKLDKESLVDILVRIQDILYATTIDDAKGREKVFFDRDKVWDAETASLIDEVLCDYGLSPEDSQE